MPLIEIRLQVQLQAVPKIRPFGFSLLVRFHSLLIKAICSAWVFTEELTCSLFATCTSSLS